MAFSSRFWSNIRYKPDLISCWRAILTNWRSCPGASLIRREKRLASRSRSAFVINKPFNDPSRVACTFDFMIIVGLFSVEVRNKRFRSTNISLYRSIVATNPGSCKPILPGRTSYSFPLIYFRKSSIRLICVRFSTLFFSYSALPVKAICASLVKSVIPALRLKFSRFASVLPSSLEIILIRSSINSAVFWAISFLSLFVLRLYISNNWLIKSCPRCKLEFFNEITATEVVLEVGSIFRFSQYARATFIGDLILAVICRIFEDASIVSFFNDKESGDWKKAKVPSSIGNTAGNFSKCFWYSLSPTVTFTSKPPSPYNAISTTIGSVSFSASCGVKLTKTGEVLYIFFEGNPSSSVYDTYKFNRLITSFTKVFERKTSSSLSIFWEELIKPLNPNSSSPTILPVLPPFLSSFIKTVADIL